MKKVPVKNIYFFDPKGVYGYLSNFYRSEFLLEGKVWHSAEQYYQSKKFEGTTFEEAIKNAASPGKAARLGRSSPSTVRSDWDEVKVLVMWKAISAKFTQNDYLCQLLLETDQAQIVERTDKDRFWGDGEDGSGLNVLGILLMKLRGRVKNHQQLLNVDFSDLNLSLH